MSFLLRLLWQLLKTLAVFVKKWCEFIRRMIRKDKNTNGDDEKLKLARDNTITLISDI